MSVLLPSLKQLSRLVHFDFIAVISKHTQTHPHSYVSQEIDREPKVRCENVVVVNIAWFWRMARAPVPEKTARTHGVAPSCPCGGTATKSHTRINAHAQERPVTSRWCSSPVRPLCSSSALLLMIFLILRKETRVRFCTLISSLWTSSGCGCLGAHSHTYYYSLGQTCWPRHQLLWIGLTKSGADPLSEAWENP